MIRGADYSNNQSTAQMLADINANPGVSFVLLKSSQGTHFVDRTRVDKALALLHRGNILLGYYHYLTEEDGRAQWDHFEDTIFSHPSIVACDLEGELLLSPKADAICRAFIARGQARGFKVGKYGSSGVSRKNHGENWRWAAWWRGTPPPYPFDIWQFTDKPLDHDLSRFTSRDALWSWWHEMSSRQGPNLRKVWYAHDPATGQTIGPKDYLSIGAAVTRHLRTHPQSSRIEIERHP